MWVLRSQVRGLEQQPSPVSAFVITDSSFPSRFIFQLMTSHGRPAVSCGHYLHGLESHTRLLWAAAEVTWLTGLS